jgi:predicted phage baseplate assembly protein
MTLPEIELDDRRFQDLVSEARLKIATLCPEWTEHNVSDPGITLIELFAWMTDLMLYRLNRVPEKIHVQLLSLLGIKLRPATPARADIRFMLSAPPKSPVNIPAHETEVGTLRTATDESIVFGVVEGIDIVPQPPVAYVLRRAGQTTAVSVEGGTARPLGDEREAFASPPTAGDAFHLGFKEPIDRLVLRLEVDAEAARGAGVEPTNPPLLWEISSGEDDWLGATVLEDTTGGFNFGSGVVMLELPRRSAQASIGGERAHWLRCRSSLQSQLCPSALCWPQSTPIRWRMNSSGPATAPRAKPSRSRAPRCWRRGPTSTSRCAIPTRDIGTAGSCGNRSSIADRRTACGCATRSPDGSSCRRLCARAMARGAGSGSPRRRGRSCACGATGTAAGCAGT